jgi:hypothetical protein
MMNIASTFRSTWARAAAAAQVLAALPATLAAQVPTVAAVAGKPGLMVGSYDIATLGYRMDEFFMSGTATSYQVPGALSSDGAWKATPAATAPFKTRLVVMRPTDPAKFNGTVLVEWFNVTGGQDGAVDWMIAHRELVRKGYAYVGVSAQKVGVDGGDSRGLGGVPLKKQDAARYGSLVHPGDAFSFDMFSQAGRLVKSPNAGGLLGPLRPRRAIAIGESQSAAYLTTYVNAVDPIARVFDGILVHSRFGSGSSLAGTSMGGRAANMPDFVRFRRDLRVPVLSVITETDLIGSGISGYHSARRPDDARLRVWELAGAAHADSYLFGGGLNDSGGNVAALAKAFVPSTSSPAGPLKEPANVGLVHHYAMQAAINALDTWLRTGRPPASTPVLSLVPGQPAGTAKIARDANGIALGGVRTPWVDVPTILISGEGDPSTFMGRLAGKAIPFDKATLARLYPGGKAEYLRKFETALDRAIRAGHILPEDRKEILEIAALNWAG